MTAARFPRVASFKTAGALRTHLSDAGIALELDDELLPPDRSPLARPIDLDGRKVGNRFCILPMEGWDGTREGEPSDLTRGRWQKFGQSGAKLIWGGEAVAVRHDGRASPHQLVMSARTQPAIAALRRHLVAIHRERFGANADADLVVGLQLTHSGRFSKPDAHDRPDPLVAWHHPVLDRRFPHGVRVLDDADIDRLVDDFVLAAQRAAAAGFQFVDVKHCHGYLAHELLGSRERPGRYGGSLDNRLRFLRNVVAGIRATAPDLGIGVRLSAFDTVPFRRGPAGTGEPDPAAPDASHFGFGLIDARGVDGALDDARAMLSVLESLEIRAVCVTGGTPYYNPHVTRPAAFPPVDGYDPPEDPLAGVARHVEATARLKAAFPGLRLVGSGYTYLQQWLPHVAQHNVGRGLTDFVGLGRMVLAYPDLPADVLAGRPLARQSFCRTFSDCTTGPRLGFVSGCYPLDPAYAARPEAKTILDVRTGKVRSPDTRTEGAR